MLNKEVLILKSIKSIFIPLFLVAIDFLFLSLNIALIKCSLLLITINESIDVIIIDRLPIECLIIFFIVLVIAYIIYKNIKKAEAETL